MARSYSDRDYGYEDDDRDQYYGRSSSRRRYEASDYEPGRHESDYEYSSQEPDYSREYGRRLSTGWDYGTAFGNPMGPRDYGSERDFERRSRSPYSREYGAYTREYPERFGREREYGGRGFGSRSRGYGSYDPSRSRHDRAYRDRGWWDRVSDEVASWFGDEEAERRRRRDEMNDYRGRGPRNYRRSDERIKEDVNDRLTDHPQLDASDIEVEVNSREVTLTGSVNSRLAKRLAEEIADSVSGVTDVQNSIRVKRDTGATETSPSSETTITGGKARARSV